MKRILRKHANLWHRKDFLLSVLSGFGLLAVSLVVNYFAGIYSSAIASNPVTDIILSHVPVFDVDAIFVEGFAVFVLFLVGVLIAEPRHIPFVLKSTAIFILIRAFSVSLTHIGPFPQQVPLDSAGKITDLFNFTGDLFFSGHTGLTFLMALIFWRERWLRLAFLAFSVVFAVTVLLGHLHYSIDVFGAYFITFTIHHLATRFFRKDALRSVGADAGAVTADVVV